MKGSSQGVAENRVRRRFDDRRDQEIHHRRRRLSRRERAAERPGLFWRIALHVFNWAVFACIIGYFVLAIDHAVSNARRERRRLDGAIVDSTPLSGWSPASDGIIADVREFFARLRERVERASATLEQEGGGGPPNDKPRATEDKSNPLVGWSSTLRGLASPVSEFWLSLARFGLGYPKST